MSGSLPSTFKAAVVEKVGFTKAYGAKPEEEVPVKFDLQDIPLKLPGHGQVLVKVIASGICGSDVHILNGQVGSQFPHVSGHEIIGDIAAIPESEDHWKVGARVGGGWHGGHCLFCTYCKRGQFLLCESQAINGVTMWGGLAQYVLLRREAVVAVPTDVDPAIYAPILCAGVTVFNSLRNMGIRSGALVGVAGVGGLGHLAIQYAANMGYKVVAIGRDPAKREESLKFGAKAYYDKNQDAVAELQKLGGADCIIVTANSAELMTQLQSGLARGGTLMTIAIVGPASFDTLHLVTKQHVVRGWPAGSSLDSEEAIDFAKHFGVETVVQKFPLEKIQEAYDIVDQGKVRYRSVIIM
ncbi:Zeta-crystallin [Dactylellina cionopaga]|nr:Zeta-crystallin [Dactylellina cionopaga]